MNNISKSILDPAIQTSKPWGNLSDKMNDPASIFVNKDKAQLQVGIKANLGQLSLGDKMNQIQEGSDGVPLLRTINQFPMDECKNTEWRLNGANKFEIGKSNAFTNELNKQFDLNS